jgi:iron complex outermembrane receptor protein
MRRIALTILMAACFAGSAVAEGTLSEESSTSGSAEGLQLQDVVVTARKVTEDLQKVPDAITVFTATTVTDFGIKTISDVVDLTPDLSFHSGDAYEPGTFNITMRGIGTAVSGWPSVAYIVDGTPQTTTDSMQRGSLEDIERIEVLRGPQSALYGFNAIAGAINVITKHPSNDWHFGADLIYGNGVDRQLSGTVSGAIVPDTVLFRLTASYRDDDGRIKSPGNDLDLDFKVWKGLQGKLYFTPVEGLELQLIGSWDKEHDGAVYQDKVPSEDQANDFSSAYNARRAWGGYQDRDLYTIAGHLQWDLPHFSLIATVAYDHIDEHNNSSVCYDNPNDPLIPAPGGGAQCLIDIAYGDAALPGEAIDEPFYESKYFQTTTSDVRLASRGAATLDWTVGVSTLNRSSIQGQEISDVIAPAPGSNELLYANWNVLKDQWWGVYGQLIWHAAPKYDLTVAARYDDETYTNVQYADQALSMTIPVYQNGVLVDTQRQTAGAFQPKGQFSYHFSDDAMGYFTVSRGFRAGFFSSALYTLPEHTTNYELGFKSTYWDHRLVMNAAMFYIDYSNQQYYENIATPPFVVTVSIPKTDIKGAELEATVLASRFLTLGASLGYLHAEVADGGGWSPDTPRFNATTYADFKFPLNAQWNAKIHLDDRYDSFQYLGQGNTFPAPAKNFLNLRGGVQSEHWDIALFARNATNTREQTQAGVAAAGGFLRFQNAPRAYGLEVRMTF